MPEGFLIGGGIIITGILLELTVGPVDWDAFAWPVNIVILCFFVIGILALGLLSKKVYAFRFLASTQVAIPILIYAVILTVVMGLTRQTTDGTWLHDMLSFWPFVLIYTLMAVILGLVVFRRCRHLTSWKRDLPFFLNHLGLFVALTCATLGNADMRRMKMITTKDQPEWRAINEQQQILQLPIAIQLERFIMEEYEDGSPKRFASDIQILTKTGKNLHTTVDVNKPVEVDGWKIYQYGYDTAMGKESEISILELVSDPWLTSVYTGIGMMLLGAVFMFFTGGRRIRS